MLCSHERVDWDPIDAEYEPDGTAVVCQRGVCLGCRAPVVLDYEPGTPVVDADRAGMKRGGVRC